MILTTDMIPIPQRVKDIPGRVSKANYELLFYAEEIPPLGFKAFYIQRDKKTASAYFEEFQNVSKPQVHILINNLITSWNLGH